MAIDYRPELGAYKSLKPFVFWAQSTLPTVFDDSLSYYETLTKLVQMINTLLENVDSSETNVERLAQAYDQLQAYVNSYFDNLSVQEEVNIKLDEMATSGVLDELMAPLIQAGLPSLVEENLPDVVEEQIGAVVEEKLPAAVDPMLPLYVTENFGVGGAGSARIAEWLTQHITNPTSPPLDTSLSVAGAAADAQATGIRITDVLANLGDRLAQRYYVDLSTGIDHTRVDPSNGNTYTDETIDYSTVEFSVMGGSSENIAFVGVSEWTNTGVAFYDIDGNYISGQAYHEYPMTVEVPANAFTAKASYIKSNYVTNPAIIVVDNMNQLIDYINIVKRSIPEATEDLMQFFKIVNPKNWWNPDGFVDNRLNTSGAEIVDATMMHTDYFIPVEPGYKVKLWRGDHPELETALYIRVITAYDENKVAVQAAGRSTQSRATYDVPEGIKYIKISCLKTNAEYSPILVIDGSTPATYYPYFEPYYEINTSLPYIKPEMFGANGNGISDDTTALQSAVDFGANLGIPVMLSQHYAISQPISARGVIFGYGTVSLVDTTTRMEGAFFNCVDSTYIHGITFNCLSSVDFTWEDKNSHTLYNVGVRFACPGELTVENCTFRNLYRNYIMVGSTDKKKIIVKNNFFDASEPVNPYMATCITLASGFKNTDSTVYIEDNIFNGYYGENRANTTASAILVTNNKVQAIYISGNTLVHMGRVGDYHHDDTVERAASRLCAIDFYFDAENVVISNNRIVDCNWTAIRLHGVRNCRIDGNIFGLGTPDPNRIMVEPIIWISDDNSSAGDAPVGASNILICNNMIASKASHYCNAVIQINSGPNHTGSEISNISIINNTIKNFSAPQYFLIDDSLKSINISGNNVQGRIRNVGSGQLPLHLLYAEAGDYTECVYKISHNELYSVGGPGIDLSLAENVSAEIIGNEFYSDSGYSVIGPSDGGNVVLAMNYFSGHSAANYAKKAIRNVSLCTESGFDNIVTSVDNYQE